MLQTRLALLFLSLLPGARAVYAQSFLPLQPHKLRYAQEVEREALAKNDSGQLAEAYYLYSKLYGAANDLVTGQRYKLKSLRILERRGDSYQLGRLCVQLADIDREQKRYRSYWQYLRGCLGLCFTDFSGHQSNHRPVYNGLSMRLLHLIIFS